MATILTGLKRTALAAAVNARFKAARVERDAARIRTRYAAEAARRGLRTPVGEELRVALEGRTRARASRLAWPRPRGELHLFLIYALCNWEAVLPGALSAFGKVSQFEWRSRGFDQSATDWLAQRDRMNAEALAAFDAVNRERPVDLVVGYLSGYTMAPEVLREMAARGAVITNFCFDDKICWPGERRGGRYTSPAAIANAVDLNLTSDPDGPLRYFAHGGLAAFHPEAADPDWYRPLDLPFDYDVSFVGAKYGWRPRLVEGLQKRGIEVTCFGKGWCNGSVANEAMSGLYARSRINLGCGGIGYSKDLLCLKGRDFEVPMSGAIYLTQDNPELRLVFDVGREILVYRDIDDCAATIRDVLADPERAALLRRAARARSLREHTYEARWNRVLTLLGALSAEARQ